jgi:hypothetical protein
VQDEKAALLAETGTNIQWFTEEKVAQRQALLAELNTALAQVTTLETQLEQVQQERDAMKFTLEAVRMFPVQTTAVTLDSGMRGYLRYKIHN